MVTHLPSMYVNFIKVTLAPTLAGHCYRHPERPANKVIICKPEHCRTDPGRPAKIMVKMMIEHAVVEIMEAWSVSWQTVMYGVSGTLPDLSLTDVGKDVGSIPVEDSDFFFVFPRTNITYFSFHYRA